jgi:transposase
VKGKTYSVKLPEEGKRRLEGIVSKGVHPARQIRRAAILLMLNEGTVGQGKAGAAPKQEEIAQRCRCHTGLVYTVSRQYVQEGLERVLNRKKRATPPVPAKVTGAIEAKIIALSRSEPPPGYSRWTLRLLEERSKAELGVELSDSTIGAVLKKARMEVGLPQRR